MSVGVAAKAGAATNVKAKIDRITTLLHQRVRAWLEAPRESAQGFQTTNDPIGRAMPRRVLVMVLLLTLICDGSPYAQAPVFSVGATWAGSKPCFDPHSPPFTLSGVPPGTRQLRFAMRDLDAPNFVHGGGSVAYNDQRLLPRGAFPYRGP